MLNSQIPIVIIGKGSPRKKREKPQESISQEDSEDQSQGDFKLK
jgi:hypothetical protein